tara:strand:+ start:921 stop:1250 length:330 start_codon:yes stop_codon:yes gene_type:complete
MLKIELFGTKNFKTLTIEENNLTPGYFIYRKLLIDYYILNFEVSTLRYKQNISSILFKYFTNDVEKISTVFLEVRKSTFIAINIYKNGFKVYDERKKYRKDGSSSLLMN